MKRNRLNIEFYIDPNHKYNEHNINILKECLVEWNKQENCKFYPFKDNEFKYEIDYFEFKEGDEHAVFHCYATHSWISTYNLYDIIEGLIKFHEK
jgi:hypothetical protein